MRNNKTNNNKTRGKKGVHEADTRGCDLRSKTPNNSETSEYNHTTGSGKFNDPEWYVNSEQILKDVARIPYPIPVGTCFTRDGKIVSDNEITQSAYDNAIPGILVSRLMPTLGATSSNASAGINVAANSIFQYVRSRISGSRKYEAVDMMLYLGAMDSIFTTITWYTRLYATCYTYHNANKYLARALVEAQGIDFDSLSNNLPNFRAALNIEIAKIRSMYLPSVMPIFKRHSWMFSHYFIEGDSEKDQIYCHAPAGSYQFQLDNDGKGMLRAHALDFNRLYTWTEMITGLRQQIDSIFRREDFNTISGDMLKAYEGNVFTLTEIPDIATVQLNNSPEVLLQFKNGKYKNIPRESTDVGLWLGSFFDYIQDSNSDLRMVGDTTLYGTPSIQSFMILVNGNDNEIRLPDSPLRVSLMHAAMNEWTKDTLLTTPSHDVEPVQNMINTRLTLGLDLADDAQAANGVLFKEAYYGSEWPVCYKLFTYHRNKSTQNISLFSRTYDRVLVISSGLAFTWTSSQEPVRSAFKYLPELSVISYDQNTSPFGIREPGRSIFEVDNYALVNVALLNGIHTAAILGEYNIPNLSIGK